MSILVDFELKLEPIRQQHAVELFELLRNPELYEFIPAQPPGDLAELQNRFATLERGASLDKQETWLNWAAYSQSLGKYIGIFQATLHGHNAEVAYQVFRPYQRMHLGSRAMKLVLDCLYRIHDIHTVSATMNTANQASIALARSLDMQLIRTNEEGDLLPNGLKREFTFSIDIKN